VAAPLSTGAVAAAGEVTLICGWAGSIHTAAADLTIAGAAAPRITLELALIAVLAVLSFCFRRCTTCSSVQSALAAIRKSDFCTTTAALLRR